MPISPYDQGVKRCQNGTMLPFDFIVPIDIDQFEDWRKEFPGAFVLSSTTFMIHRADCHHFNLREGRVVTPKWVSPSVDLLQKLAESKGWAASICGCIGQDQSL